MRRFDIKPIIRRRRREDEDHQQDRLWSPLVLRGDLAAWYDPSDASTVVLNGQNVSMLADKSGKNRALKQGLASSQPAYVPNSQNGLAVVSFDGYHSIATDEFVHDHDKGSFFLVGSMGATVETYEAFFVLYRIDTDYTTLLRRNGNANSMTAVLNKEFVTGGNITPDFTLWDCSYSLRARAALAQNGVVVIQRSLVTSTGVSAQTRMMFGGPTYLVGTLGEVVIAQSHLELPLRHKIQGYLAWKWGLVGNLPADHPYKAAAPLA